MSIHLLYSKSFGLLYVFFLIGTNVSAFIGSADFIRISGMENLRASSISYCPLISGKLTRNDYAASSRSRSHCNALSLLLLEISILSEI